ncbi:hypothetical protein EN805_20215 [bacterium M00.F.Ca.ET.162.01.1.1]|nr:hypothetical protein EN848_08180 [bacterium M00.F.Ca.ET.205.01.1.1]TGZ41125.1 hypothetical protein EN805_20215 [bacterium M00.F.Ca.ET.162.01.1.1]
MSGKAVAGWYHVENYEGFIGPNPVHLSLQTYGSFGSGINVEGSYFYDARQVPIAIYGKVDGSRLSFCEIADDKEFNQVLRVGSNKKPIDTKGCPFSLDRNENGVTGTWSKGADKYPVTLKKVASFDDNGEVKIDGIVEIPFWAQTALDRFAGVYADTSAGFCMTKLQVIKKRSGKVVQEIAFKDDDACSAGMLMTSIYLNVEKWVEGGKDVISVNFSGGGAGHTEDYAFSPKAKKYRKRK